jgi:hypothetical protein
MDFSTDSKYLQVCERIPMDRPDITPAVPSVDEIEIIPLRKI